MDAHHLDIVALAWSRALGLPDTALARPGARQVLVDDDSDRVQFLRLAGASALVGPRWALERAADLDDDALSERSTLLDLTKDHGGSCPGALPLAYTAEVGADTGESDDPLISHDLAQVRALEALCPPDEVTEAALSDRERWFTLLDEDGAPVAAAGYREWQGIVADVGALTAPDLRRRGHAAVVARLTTNDAVDEGMIAQWRSHPENIASWQLAATLGYQVLGSHTLATVHRSSV